MQKSLKRAHGSRRKVQTRKDPVITNQDGEGVGGQKIASAYAELWWKIQLLLFGSTTSCPNYGEFVRSAPTAVQREDGSRILVLCAWEVDFEEQRVGADSHLHFRAAHNLLADLSY